MALAIALGFVLAALPGLAPAQQPGAGSGTPNYILEISVEGNRNTGPNEVLTVIGSRAGSTIDPRMIVQDIKAVHALGYYDAVRVELAEKPGQGYLMIFQVKEKPKVGSLTVEGISRIDYTKTFEGFKLKAGGFFTQALLEQNHAVIRDAYRASGFLSVKIITTVDEDKQENTVDVTIRIEEAPRFYITDIRIHNTRVFSEMHLKRKMQSMEVDCFDWMNDSGVFDENKVNQDLQSISALYLEQGYIRLFIEKPKVVLIHNPDFSRIEVDIDISEGEQYFTGKIDVQGDILGSKERLMELIGLKTGNPYNPLQQNRDIFALSEVYQEQGYAFAQVRPDVRINDETKIVDVTYNIAKGEKAYIGRIEFQGNRETRDYVLRREFKVRENELFNGRKLRESHQALMALGYFDPSMKMDTEPTETSNVLDVVARVKETQTGTLQAQIGYSDSSGMLGSVSVSKGNFLGKGQTIRFSMQWAQKSVTKEFSADFIEPHLLDTDFTS
ncbi:MAG: outer membrane protein assembly factor BamA, partial [Deltaproteobacteria bacterium]|nr:outer membrane protein assembly factor BamA [Deltaproteobacteria bacterium]